MVIMGIIVLVGGIAFGLWTLKTNKQRLLEIQSMQTMSIADAIDIVNTMTDTDPSYRHYVEIKGTLSSDEPVKTPYTDKKVAFYKAKCHSVNEVTDRVKDDDGEYRTRVSKEENLLSSEQREAVCYIKDSSCDKKVYVSVENFKGDADLIKSCDRIEQANSSFVSSHSGFFGSFADAVMPGARFLGYRLQESVFNFNIPVYCLGELFKSGDDYRIEKCTFDKKASVLTHKSEDSLVQAQKGSITFSYAVIVIAIVVGVGMIVSNFM